MKMKELLKLFDGQPAKKHQINTDRGVEDFKTGPVFYGLRYMATEQSTLFPNMTRKTDVMNMFVVTSCDRQDIKSLKKHTFEKFTAGGWPIFQTATYVKDRKAVSDA